MIPMITSPCDMQHAYTVHTEGWYVPPVARRRSTKPNASIAEEQTPNRAHM